ncbi:MAG TPA: tetratricopeptide repeat protein [Tepidisphaeraceae bacterium]|jgi:tetratricopeptide (TPR) repeat protein
MMTTQPTHSADSLHDDHAVWHDPYDRPAIWREWIQIAFVLILAAVAFLPAITSGFVWQDAAAIQLDEFQSSWHGLFAHWRHLRLDDIYQPLAFTSYWIQFNQWEAVYPFGYHAVTLAFHLANVFLAWRILRRLEVKGCLFVAGLFAVHPVLVQPVSWITQQPIVIASFFALLSTVLWFALVRIHPTPSIPMPEIDAPEWRRDLTYAFCFLCFLAALLTHPFVSALPVILVLLTRWKNNQLSRRQKLALVPFFSAGFVLFVLAIWTQKTGWQGEKWALAPASRAFISGRNLWFSLFKLAVPWPLLFAYPKWNLSVANVFNWLALGGAVAMVIAIAIKRQRLARPAVVALLAYILLLLPWPILMNLAKTPSYVADAHQYLAALAILALVGSLLAHWVERARMVVPARYVFAALILAGCATLSWNQSALYASSQKLWQHTLNYDADSPIANLELGQILLVRQKHADAETHLQKAAALRPDDVQSMLLYGTALERQGKLAQAESLYNQWRQRLPNHSSPVRCLAGIANLRGNRVLAIDLYGQALQLNPKDDIAQNNLATALAREGRTDEAMEHYQRALEINPRLVQAHLNMAGLLFGMRKNEEAFGHVEAALKSDRNNFDAYMSAGGVCMQMKRFNDASRMFRRATELRPDAWAAFNALGCALAAQNHLDEAIECFGRALDLKPDYEDARANLASAKKQRG